jgi:hypothetical protein
LIKNDAAVGAANSLKIYTWEIRNNDKVSGRYLIDKHETLAAPLISVRAGTETKFTKFLPGNLGKGVNYHEEEFVRHGASLDKKGPLIFTVNAGF